MGPRQLFYPHTPSPSCPASTSPPSPLHPPAYYLSFPTQPRSLHNILSVSSLHYSYLLPHYIFLKEFLFLIAYYILLLFLQTSSFLLFAPFQSVVLHFVPLLFVVLLFVVFLFVLLVSYALGFSCLSLVLFSP